MSTVLISKEAVSSILSMGLGCSHSLCVAESDFLTLKPTSASQETYKAFTALCRTAKMANKLSPCLCLTVIVSLMAATHVQALGEPVAAGYHAWYDWESDSHYGACCTIGKGQCGKHMGCYKCDGGDAVCQPEGGTCLKTCK